MDRFEEGDEDAHSDEISDEDFEEFMRDDDLYNIPLINMVNSNYQQLKRNKNFVLDAVQTNGKRH